MVTEIKLLLKGQKSERATVGHKLKAYFAIVKVEICEFIIFSPCEKYFHILSSWDIDQSH